MDKHVLFIDDGQSCQQWMFSFLMKHRSSLFYICQLISNINKSYWPKSKIMQNVCVCVCKKIDSFQCRWLSTTALIQASIISNDLDILFTAIVNCRYIWYERRRILIADLIENWRVSHLLSIPFVDSIRWLWILHKFIDICNSCFNVLNNPLEHDELCIFIRISVRLKIIDIRIMLSIIVMIMFLWLSY
jgi:hypothetical protein